MLCISCGETSLCNEPVIPTGRADNRLVLLFLSLKRTLLLHSCLQVNQGTYLVFVENSTSSSITSYFQSGVQNCARTNQDEHLGYHLSYLLLCSSLGFKTLKWIPCFKCTGKSVLGVLTSHNTAYKLDIPTTSNPWPM